MWEPAERKARMMVVVVPGSRIPAAAVEGKTPEAVAAE
jgi:hypothetical protein